MNNIRNWKRIIIIYQQKGKCQIKIQKSKLKKIDKIQKKKKEENLIKA